MLNALAVLWRRPVQLLAFGFGSGLAPKAPGTAGTVVAVGIYLAVLQHLPPLAYAAMLVATALFGIWLCGRAAEQMGLHDHPGIVWDEFVGYWVAMAFAPPGWWWALWGFAWFRVFDIIKPWPINWLDKRLKGGMGIMLDDLLAGVYSAACLQLMVIAFR